MAWYDKKVDAAPPTRRSGIAPELLTQDNCNVTFSTVIRRAIGIVELNYYQDGAYRATDRDQSNALVNIESLSTAPREPTHILATCTIA